MARISGAGGRWRCASGTMGVVMLAGGWAGQVVAQESRPGVAPAEVLRLVPATSGNEVRYRVREQLAGISFPSDAVGVTGAVGGALVLRAEGAVDREESRFEVDLASLTSDRDRRDNFLRRRTLDTGQYPRAVLVPTEVRGLVLPLPASGRVSFTLIGDLTIRGVTRPTTWEVTAEAAGEGYRGTATTSFTFETFGMTKPRVASVLSVEDTIRLEYDFHLIPEPSP